MAKQADEGALDVKSARQIGCDLRYARMAGYNTPEQLDTVFNEAVRAKKIAKYLSFSGAFVLIGALGLGILSKDEDLKAKLSWPALPAVAAILISNKIAERRYRLKLDIERDTQIAGAQHYEKQTPPQPR